MCELAPFFSFLRISHQILTGTLVHFRNSGQICPYCTCKNPTLYNHSKTIHKKLSLYSIPLFIIVTIVDIFSGKMFCHSMVSLCEVTMQVFLPFSFFHVDRSVNASQFRITKLLSNNMWHSILL